MAEFQDLEETGDIGELEAEELESQKNEVSQEDDDLDPRYRGKSVKDIAKMHQEAEKLISRQSQEVGEVRRLADELIKSQLNTKVPEEKPPVDFFDNPEEAVRKAVESNPELLQAKQYALAAKQQMAKQELLSKHPDALELAKNDEFRNWINASPVRSRLAVQADQNYDVEAANELYSTYKELKSMRTKQVSEADKASRDKTLNSVAVDTGGSGESSKKIYRRADLIQLKLKDPQAFAARQDEIDAAYREGRVR